MAASRALGLGRRHRWSPRPFFVWSRAQLLWSFGLGSRGGIGRSVSLAAAFGSPPRRLDRKTHGKNEHRTVEQGLDKERRPKLIESGDSDREDRNRENRPPDVHPSRPNRSRAEQSCGESGQQIFLPDRTLTDLELRLQDDSGEGGQRPGRDEPQRDKSSGGDSIQFGGA